LNTSNPPGREDAGIDWIGSSLEGSGCDCQIVAQEPERSKFVARLLEQMDKAPQ
jgi:hypothetical protein